MSDDAEMASMQANHRWLIKLVWTAICAGVLFGAAVWVYVNDAKAIMLRGIAQNEANYLAALHEITLEQANTNAEMALILERVTVRLDHMLERLEKLEEND